MHVAPRRWRTRSATLAVRGAPAIGIAAAYGYALAAERGEDLDAGVRRARRVAADRGQPRLGARAAARRSDARAGAGAPRGGGRAVPADGASRRGAPRAGDARARRTATRAGSRPAATARPSARSGRRGRTACSLTCWVGETRPLLQGARLTAWELETLGDPARGDRGLGGRAPDEPRRGRLRRHRRRPDRGERRRREQDRHVLARARGGPPPDPALRRRADLDRRPRHADRRGRSRSRSATERSSRPVSPRAIPAFDVTPAELIAAIVTEEGVHRAPYAESLPRVVHAR